MHRRALVACAAGALLLGGPGLARAGQVRRVGPGQSYATIQAAVDAAQPGDLVLVDPGSYPGFSIAVSKELAIVASGASFALAPDPAGPEISVENLALGDVVTIQGARIAYADRDWPAVRVRGNAGAVRFLELEIDMVGDLIGARVQAALEVEDTATFWLLDSSVWSPGARSGSTLSTRCAGNPLLCNDGISALQLSGSHGMIQNSRLRGYYNDDTLGPTGYGGDGLRLVGQSSAWLLQNVVGPGFPAIFRGGDGIYGGHAIHQLRDPEAPALNRSCGGNVTPSYEPGQRLQVGVGANGSFYGLNNYPGIMGSGGSGTGFLVPRHCKEGERNEVTLASSLVPLGGVLTVRVRTNLASAYRVFFSDSSRYDFSFPPFAGRLMLDPAGLLYSLVGASAPQTTQTHAFPVVPNTSLVGLQLTIQALVGPPGGPVEAISLPALAVIGP
jgi:hypothetical protein